MSKWTPAPWETLAEDGFTVIGYVPTEPDGGPSMVVISDASASLPDDMARANARLIAGAPAMAELLERIVNSDMAQMAEDEGRVCAELSDARALLERINK